VSGADSEARPTAVLFVCLGNICRSPTAEALFKQRLDAAGADRRFTVRSAGIIARPGDVATLDAIRVAREHGVRLDDHLSTPLTAELLDAQDLVVTMDRMNVEHILRLAPDLGQSLRLLMSFADDPALGSEVIDPIGQSIEVYKRSYAQIAAGIEGLMRALDLD